MASDTKGGGGRGSEREEKKHKQILKVFFFLLQKSYKIIIGPQKHVLHLVWSVLGISTDIKTVKSSIPPREQDTSCRNML